MSDELERLRADLEVLERYSLEHGGMASCKASIQDKIARLEAEVAPRREHRASVEFMRKTVYAAADVPKVVAYVDHLTAERDRLAARVAELEAAAIRVDFENGVATLNPDALVLDPARVLATAAEAIDIAGFMLEKNTKHNVKVVLRDASTHQKPYQLKGGSE